MWGDIRTVAGCRVKIFLWPVPGTILQSCFSICSVPGRLALLFYFNTNLYADLSTDPPTATRRYVRALQLGSWTKWRIWRTSEARPANIPSNPHRTYEHDGWQGYGHWLGTNDVARVEPGSPGARGVRHNIGSERKISSRQKNKAVPPRAASGKPGGSRSRFLAIEEAAKYVRVCARARVCVADGCGWVGGWVISVWVHHALAPAIEWSYRVC